MVATLHEGALPLFPAVETAFSLSRAPARAIGWLRANRPAEPTLVIDTEIVAARFRALARGLPGAAIHFAVKASPEPAILRRLAAEGGRFDAASRAEIEMCLSAGAAPADISFGNTVKRGADIAWAHDRGVTLFMADAVEEIDKIAAHAPGARVCLRILVEHSPGDWPLSRKFGCAPEAAAGLMDRARATGLRPEGISFHVGSQTREPEMWRPVLTRMAGVWRDLRAAGHDLALLNIGGGFPAGYGGTPVDLESYAGAVGATVRELFGPVPRLMAEPGRALAAEAGVIEAEVLLVSRKRERDLARWVYLDIGRFSGLAETEGEAIRYAIETTADGGPTGPCILAGPSCDSVDVLYERRPVQLPLGLAAGDRVRILATGAYTASYASVGFNGFAPLRVVCL